MLNAIKATSGHPMLSRTAAEYCENIEYDQNELPLFMSPDWPSYTLLQYIMLHHRKDPSSIEYWLNVLSQFCPSNKDKEEWLKRKRHMRAHNCIQFAAYHGNHQFINALFETIDGKVL